MTAHTSFPVRTPVTCAFCAHFDRVCDCSEREAADTGMSPMADRLRRSRDNMQFIADLPPVVGPDAELARRKADEAVRRLIGGLEL